MSVIDTSWVWEKSSSLQGPKKMPGLIPLKWLRYMVPFPNHTAEMWDEITNGRLVQGFVQQQRHWGKRNDRWDYNSLQYFRSAIRHSLPSVLQKKWLKLHCSCTVVISLTRVFHRQRGTLCNVLMVLPQPPKLNCSCAKPQTET